MLTLTLALARYAIDLLAVVAIVLLVGLAVRAVGEWLLDADSVGGWAISAVALSLGATVAFGALFLAGEGYGDRQGRSSRLPEPLASGLAYLEEHGWGRRVLVAPGPVRVDMTVPVPDAPPARQVVIRPPSQPESPRRSVELSTVRPGSGAATPQAARPAGPLDEAEAAAQPAAGIEPAGPVVAPPRARAAITLRSSAPVTTVGVSVRLTARVTGEAGEGPPRGTVTFYCNGLPIGTAPLEARQHSGVASLGTLALPVGASEIVAEYSGDDAFLPGRSAPLAQTVTR